MEKAITLCYVRQEKAIAFPRRFAIAQFNLKIIT